ncbi:MAG: TIGR04283 family arsenosugar biosynthesis glycosyltransferase [Blastocatellia bacterium]
MISIIVPTLNEAKTIRETARRLLAMAGEAEIIVVDGGSADRTVALARGCGLRVLTAPRGRGAQLAAGGRAARGDVLLFLHADTQLPADALALIEQALRDPRVRAGNFSLRFAGASWGARLLTRLYPLLRLGGMCYGDSGIFARRATYEAAGGFRDFPIFEDCDLYRRLRKHGRFIRLPARAVTSARRFEGRFLRTFALWSLLQVMYWLGVSPHRLDRLYRPAR